jgi:hypothetical protein
MDDLDRLRSKYRDMNNQALLELHAEGSETYAEPGPWLALDEEVRRRGLEAVVRLGRGAFLNRSRLRIDNTVIDLSEVVWIFGRLTTTTHFVQFVFPVAKTRDAEVVLRLDSAPAFRGSSLATTSRLPSSGLSRRAATRL